VVQDLQCSSILTSMTFWIYQISKPWYPIWKPWSIFISTCLFNFKQLQKSVHCSDIVVNIELYPSGLKILVIDRYNRCR
jgi:hypothetical protein